MKPEEEEEAMPTEEQVKECLVDITLAGAALNSDTQEWLKSKISEGTGSLPGIEQANVGHSKMAETIP
jgi:hypothetical protein